MTRAPLSLVRATLLGFALLLCNLPAVGQEIRKEIRKAIVIDDNGKVTEIKGEGDGDTMHWFQNGERIEGDGNHFEFFALGDDMLRGGGYLGVELTELTDPLRTHFGVPEGLGVMVAAVDPESPAASAGLQAADIITSVNGKDVSNARGLSRAIRELEEGDAADLEVWRGGKLETLTAAVAHRDPTVFKIGGNGVFRFESDSGDENFFLHSEGVRGEALEKLQEYFSSEDWESRLEGLEGLDFEALHERMREVEDQLEKIEIHLKVIEKDGGDDPNDLR